MVTTLATSQNPLKKTLFVVAGYAHRKNERWDEIQFPFAAPPFPAPPLNANVCFFRDF